MERTRPAQNMFRTKTSLSNQAAPLARRARGGWRGSGERKYAMFIYLYKKIAIPNQVKLRGCQWNSEQVRSVPPSS